MALLSKDEILGARDLQTEDVEVPEWGGVVRVRSLTGSERDRYEQEIARSRNGQEDAPVENVRALLVAMCAIDENGKRLFSLSEVRALGGKNALPLNRVFAVGRRLSGLSLEDVEELEGNSEPAPSDGSTSS